MGISRFIFVVIQLIALKLTAGCGLMNLRIAVFNEEVNDANGSCVLSEGCSLSNLSCRYISYINSSIAKTFYSDLESLKNVMQDGSVCGGLYFSDNFTDALVARIALGSDSDDETLTQSEVRVWLANSNPLIYTAMIESLEASYQEFSMELLRDCNNFANADNRHGNAELCVNNRSFLASSLKPKNFKSFSICWSYNRDKN